MAVRRGRVLVGALAGAAVIGAGSAVTLAGDAEPDGRSASSRTTPPAAASPSESVPQAAPSAAPPPAAPAPSPSIASPAAAGFRSSISPVTAARLGSSHRTGCPVPVADLRLVSVSYRDDGGRPQQGEIVVHTEAAAAAVTVFRALYDAGFPITRVATVEEFGSDDNRVMAANVSSGFNCRTKTGGTAFSEHSYGRAIDINPIQNPYLRGDTVEPPAGRRFLDRSDVRPGMVLGGDVVVRAFAAIGWEWGGNFRGLLDYQHFSANGR